jgi:phosphoribosylamine--glycine ligase
MLLVCTKQPRREDLLRARNGGISRVAECVAIKPEEIDKLIEFAQQESIDLTFVGGESALALGIVDEFEKRV